MKHIQTFESFLFEANLSNNFRKGDKVRVNKREGHKELVGKIGTVVDTDPKKGVVYIDFGEKIIGDGFTTYDLDGLIKTETGLGFFDHGWLSSKIDPRFDLRNIERV